MHLPLDALGKKKNAQCTDTEKNNQKASNRQGQQLQLLHKGHTNNSQTTRTENMAP